MGLQLDGRAIVLSVRRLADVARLTDWREMILHQHSVLNTVTAAGVCSVPSSWKTGAVQTTS